MYNRNNYKRVQKILAITFSVFLAAVLAALLALTAFWQKPPAVLSDAEAANALQTYAQGELSDLLVTTRSDAMRVTERNVARPTPKILSDEYTISTSFGSKTFTFPDYPYPGHAVKQESLSGYAEAAGLSAETYFLQYKYALMSQGYNLVAALQQASADKTLTQESLYKHPAADLQYGAVGGTNNAVEKQITLDPTYRAYHATGLYLPAGEAATVQVSGLAAGESLSIVFNLHNSLAWNGGVDNSALAELGLTSSGNYFTDNDILFSAGKTDAVKIHDQWKKQDSRLPWITAEFTFGGNGTYVIGTPFGGILHVNVANCLSAASLTIRGAVETPHYVLGVTTPEYYDQYLRNAPGVYSVLDTENGQLIGPADSMRQCGGEEMQRLALLWHSFFSVDETFTGGTFNRANLVKFDVHVPAGAAVALGNYVYACPSGWYNDAMSLSRLQKYGQWGILHEIGHNHDRAYGQVWGFGEGLEGEVRNNALTCLAYIKLLDIGTYMDQNGNNAAEHGFVAHPYSALKHSLAISGKADFSDMDYFDALSMYVNLMHSFGADEFYRLLATYGETPSYVPDGSSGNKRSDFIYRCSKVYGMDFRDYFNDIYKANVSDAAFSAQQLSEMELLPKYVPIANFYAGGIDGLSTGGDFRMGFGIDYDFDLVGKTVCSEGFEVTSVGSPRYGSITKTAQGTWRYSCPESYVERDYLSFSVRLADGQPHAFKVTIRFDPNLTLLEKYGNVAARNIDDALAEIESKTPVTSAANLGIAAYNTVPDGTKTSEVAANSFLFKAPENGNYTFYINADDLAVLYAGADFDSLREVVRINSYVAGFLPQNSFSVELSKGQVYAFRLLNLNTGGRGECGIRYSVDGGAIAAIPAEYAYFPTLSGSEKPFEFKQNYMLSKKSGQVLGYLSSPKSEWTVLSAPDAQDGNVTTVDGVEIDKKSWLIDGDASTIYHTVWRGGEIPPLPHDFVIDTGKVQTFNFVTLTTRYNSAGNSYVSEYRLYVSADGENWVNVSQGKAAYSNLQARIAFDSVSARYLRLSVLSTSGQTFTVIAEIDAGFSAPTKVLTNTATDKLFKTSGWEVSDAESGSGYVSAQSAGEKLVFRFTGDAVQTYSDFAEDYGDADIYIDGKYFGKADLSGKNASRQLSFAAEKLGNGEHTMEVITASDKYFNLAFFGIDYSATLLNAPDIYKERALTIALIVVAVLFVLLLAFVLLYFLVPGFAEKIDPRRRRSSYGKKSAKKEEKQPAIETQQQIEEVEEEEEQEQVAEAKLRPREVTFKKETAPKVAQNAQKGQTAAKKQEPTKTTKTVKTQETSAQKQTKTQDNKQENKTAKKTAKSQTEEKGSVTNYDKALSEKSPKKVRNTKDK